VSHLPACPLPTCGSGVPKPRRKAARAVFLDRAHLRFSFPRAHPFSIFPSLVALRSWPWTISFIQTFVTSPSTTRPTPLIFRHGVLHSCDQLYRLRSTLDLEQEADQANTESYSLVAHGQQRVSIELNPLLSRLHGTDPLSFPACSGTLRALNSAVSFCSSSSLSAPGLLLTLAFCA
jgi:hypothetical protein